MSLIEGIGDEVLHFFIALFVIITIAVAWWTTNIRRDPWQIRTVYLIDRSFRRIESRFLSNHTESSTISESTVPVIANNEENNENVQESETSSSKPPEPSTSSSNSEETNNQIEQEQNDIVQTMDADTSVLRLRRLNFYENKPESTSESSAKPAKDSGPSTSNKPDDTNTNINNEVDNTTSSSDTSDNQKCSIPKTENSNSDNNTETSSQNIPNDESHIRIKLKYINDDLRLVDGRLEELLGDFKRRHFSSELSSNKLVRLIFNGQVLQRDNDTLQSIGLFDNCVVHCLVHQQRNPTSDSSDSRSNEPNVRRFNPRSFMNNNNNNNNRDWDLSNLLIGTVSFSLGTAWYFRYQYPHLFTVTATVALVAITGIFTVVSVGIYFPDPEAVAPQVENLVG